MTVQVNNLQGAQRGVEARWHLYSACWLSAWRSWLEPGSRDPATSSPAASDRPLGEVVDEYVREALRSNLSLQSETLEVERNLASLDAARAQFLPKLEFAARYTRAEGGREIDVPLGSLLNPIYSTLNDLLAAQGRTGQFPQIGDQTINFVREREQDTRVTLRQPIYAPAIPAAIRAQRAALKPLSSAESRLLAA